MIFSDAMQSLRNTIVFDSKDYSASRRDAWVYGIVVGWDGLPSLSDQNEGILEDHYRSLNMRGWGVE